MPPYNPEKLLVLAARLAPDDAALLSDLQVACARFADAAASYDPLTTEPPDDPFHTISPWLALVDALKHRKLLIEFDWRTDPEDVPWSFMHLVDHPAVRPAFWDWFNPEDWRTAYADVQLKAVAARLHPEGYALANLNIESDSYPVMIIANNRVVFNIRGNHYRLVVAINYAYQIVYIRFVGSHQDYDQIDAATI
jgi:mRNA-degrading endonuclease HigB of HigAB toxin-antitoxin module